MSFSPATMGRLETTLLALKKSADMKFVTFVDPNCALNFFNSAMTNQITLNTRRLKVGWGKHSGTMNPALMQAIKSGASRNVYIGQVQDFEKFNADKLRADFGQYGGEYRLDCWAIDGADEVDIEMINFLQEKNAAFVNLYVSRLMDSDGRLTW